MNPLIITEVMRRLYPIILILYLFACDEVGPDRPSTPPHYFVLTAYEENKSLSQTFDYEDDRLVQQSFIDEDGQIRTIEFVYRDDGLVDSIYIRQSWFPRNLKLHYEDTLLREWEVWNLAGNFVQWVFIERDDQNRITKMSRISFNLGEVYNYTFEWDGPNISSYEFNWFSNYGSMTEVYEYTYDHYVNPYYSTFLNIGFNFQYFFPFPLPLTKNNPLEQVFYFKGDPQGTEEVTINKYFYVGNYPYIRESYLQQGDSIRKIYGVFRYKKIIP